MLAILSSTDNDEHIRDSSAVGASSTSSGNEAFGVSGQGLGSSL